MMFEIIILDKGNMRQLHATTTATTIYYIYIIIQYMFANTYAQIVGESMANACHDVWTPLQMYMVLVRMS